jgi:hypothetical protein
VAEISVKKLKRGRKKKISWLEESVPEFWQNIGRKEAKRGPRVFSKKIFLLYSNDTLPETKANTVLKNSQRQRQNFILIST